ncbi:beta-lactamase [Methylobacterium sp. 4-46]|uniref:serine hydrolase domain-containing protein n=1 Tax=unclassified Methylobacterium TaxID=2615210 RepID=UPI000152E139|nr:MULTISPECIES: serine hydrolase domain-containing protein [Methylobacterium]ACA21070.1 beta-lactamase [Methylobacterium sp. 4-46]WFT80219.1 serine hydrolase [Methylobacterium nodulans]
MSETSLILRLDRVIDGALAAERIVGAVVLVGRDGETVYARAAGLADREAAAPMRPDTIFRLASVSKPFVAAAALALVAQGRLALDRPITEWLPDFAPRHEGRPARITLRHLLSHASGLGYGFLESADGPLHRAGVSDGMDRCGLTLAENLRRLAGVPLLFAPGTGFRYGLGLDVAGALVAAATGLTLPEAVRRLVAEPLGLRDTGFALGDASRLAAAYADGVPLARRMREPDTLHFGPGLAGIAMDPARIFDPEAFPSGGAGMVGTAAEVMRLLEALRRGGAPLMPPDLAAEMGRDQVAKIDLEGSPGWGYGLGFAVLRDPRAAGVAETPGTWRWGGVYGHSWLVDPARGLTLVALTNTALEGMWSSGRFALDLGRAIAAAP